MEQDTLSIFHGPNAGYVLELYDRYREDPESVDPQTRTQFDEWANRSAFEPAATQRPSDPTTLRPSLDVTKVVAAARVARLVRELGHLAARIDPLGSEPPGDPGLVPETHDITEKDLADLPASVVGGPLSDEAPNALVAIQRLRQAYCGSIGYEDDHIQIAEERLWIRMAAETGYFLRGIGIPYKADLLARLTEVEALETFLHKTFVGQKWFSIQGNDMLIPMLDRIIAEAAVQGTREVVMGMAHRGRLNVLAHILGKPYSEILAEFKTHKREEGASVAGAGTKGWSGDVKYHLGAHLMYQEEGVEAMPVTLAPNPSHLEFVNPVVVGRTRAAQEDCNERGKPRQDGKAALPILIHGDAAFPGQGIVAETLNLSQLPGYRVGGTIHIIVNNQIGFTTAPGDGRSTLYSSDLAKGFEIPIVHVNADDPEACIACARMAYAYRERFGKDFLIDLVGYRRYGHNEGDPPEFTQPRMYEQIAKHPTVRAHWAVALERQEIVTHATVEKLMRTVLAELKEAATADDDKSVHEDDLELHIPTRGIKTSVPAKALIELNESLLARPEGFCGVAKLEKNMTARREEIHKPNAIEWGHAEALAFASILADGTPIRLAGQDSERGTFLSRSLVLHDPNTGGRCVPLQNLPQARASFAVYNSPLSENAVLGFEYGYSMHSTKALVLWEAQFGDFANSAQVIIDQFIVSGHTKWNQTPSLVLLLPHGYEGQGPEHSSTRLERFLQLAADDNIRVVNCTTAAQFFHVIRRQAALLEASPRPLIVMSPKSLLRHPLAKSSLSDLSEGSFLPVLDDSSARERSASITRLIFCSGKVWADLVSNKAQPIPPGAAIVRIEELYPFPTSEVEHIIGGYPALREVVWLQEEPMNMGAWNYAAPRIRPLIERGMLRYVGRPESASPSEGSMARHQIEQARILAAAVNDVPEVQSNRSVVGHAG